MPERCYIFLTEYPDEVGSREKLLESFQIPMFVACRACTEMNGYFGCRVSYDDDGRVATCSTWFRCLVKMVRKVEVSPYESEKEYVTREEDKSQGYRWFEMGFFTYWDRHCCRVMCVDTPDDLPQRLKAAHEQRPSHLDFSDPFTMHTKLLDQIILYYEISVWRVRDPVRKLEESRKHPKEHVFNEVHDTSRHAIHTSEILAMTIETMAELQRHQTDIHKRLSSLRKTYHEQAKTYTGFQIQLVKGLKLRSESNQKRLENEVHLAFHNIAHEDNTVMKSIALLTMIFLPATFLSALFSTTFFAFSDKGWRVSPRFWIYWAIAIPATILVVIIYTFWVFCRKGNTPKAHPPMHSEQEV